MLALAFLLLIGVSLVADGLGFHIPKGYIYAAMGFSVLVEAINIIAKQRRQKGKVAHHATAGNALREEVTAHRPLAVAAAPVGLGGRQSGAAKPKAKTAGHPRAVAAEIGAAEEAVSRAVVVRELGGPEVLKLEERPRARSPGRARSWSATRRSASTSSTSTSGPASTRCRCPLTPGGEGAGVVTAVGDGVTDFRVGRPRRLSGPGGAYADESPCRRQGRAAAGRRAERPRCGAA